ncbi:MAG: hypothetical protein K0B07_00665 [DPANN group archaeon]|nr:hypothetical protein [DPANN group archaeon]
MVYASAGFSNPKISVGSNGRSIKYFKNFTYSFVTVLTSRGPFKVNSTPVRRVCNLSGWNYWGKPTSNSVAFSVKEIFLKNYRSGIPKNFINHLTKELNKIDTEYSYFFPEL